MSFLPWFIAVIIAAGSVALIFRLMGERMHDAVAFLQTRVAELVAHNTKLENDNAKKDELIEILRGEIADLNRALGQEEGTFAAKLREAKLKKQVKDVSKDDEPKPKHDEPPPADWMPEEDDEQ